MTDLSRGTRPRRGGRRPGWLLLTVLLVLAIAASSALVFTERAELLKLAVILSLWAAAVAAFVSVIYRRQSDLDRAKARDLKLVYDLQLDREISARREYELEVESQLRRELTSELRIQTNDEVAALRAELAALRNNLEILFDADLTHRPAIETERTTVRAYGDWQRDTDPGRRGGMRFVAPAVRQERDDDDAENAIIDVPEEPSLPEEEVRVEAVAPPYEPPEAARPVWVPPQSEPTEYRQPPPPTRPWQPVADEGQWLPPGVPSSHGVSTNGMSAAAPPPVEPVGEEPRRGRHSTQNEPVGAPSAASAWRSEPHVNNAPPPPLPPPAPQAAPAARHGAAEDEGRGQSVAELLARLQTTAGTTGSGRRRRRDD